MQNVPEKDFVLVEKRLTMILVPFNDVTVVVIDIPDCFLVTVFKIKW